MAFVMHYLELWVHLEVVHLDAVKQLGFEMVASFGVVSSVMVPAVVGEIATKTRFAHMLQVILHVVHCLLGWFPP